MALATRSFDEQAGAFDQRAGMPASVSHAIATELVHLAQLGPGDVVLEVGAGTGQIGLALSQQSVSYVGFDLSIGMLEVFNRRRRGTGRPVSLIAADGDKRWPVGD